MTIQRYRGFVWLRANGWLDKFTVFLTIRFNTTTLITMTSRFTTFFSKLFLLCNKCCRIIFVIVICNYISNTYAANERSFENIADLGEELLEEQARQRESYEAEVALQTLVCGEEQPQISDQDAQAFIDVTSIEISGTELLTQEEQATLLCAYIGKRISIAQLKQLAADITRYIMDKGYLTTRAYIPKQAFGEGRVTIEVVEGVVECIDLPCSKKWTAFPWVEGRLLKAKNLEQGMEQINRLASENAVMTLWPGEELGGSIVRIQERVCNPYRLYVGIDNHGQKLTGEYRGKVVFEADNFFKLNDAFQLTVCGNHLTQAIAGHWDMPFGYWNVGYDGSFSRYRYHLPNAKADTMHGTSYNNTFSLKRLLVRHPCSTIHVKGELVLRKPTRRLNDLRFETPSLTLMRIGIEQHWEHKRSLFDLGFFYERGLSILGAHKDPARLPKKAAHSQFNKIEADIRYHQCLYKALNFDSCVSAQYAWVGLPSTEQLTLTDFSSGVRGCSDLSLSTDRGIVIRNELSYCWQPMVRLRLIPFLLFDWGVGEDIDAKGQSFASVGGGLRFGYSRVSGGVTLAKIIHPKHFQGCPFQLKFNLSLKLF